MRPIKFPRANTVYAENQPEYLPLPVEKKQGPSGEAISCWEFSYRERILILLFGKMYISVLTFNNPLQPMLPSVEYKVYQDALGS